MPCAQIPDDEITVLEKRDATAPATPPPSLIALLPPELLCVVFSFIDARDLVDLALVSWEWLSVSRECTTHLRVGFSTLVDVSDDTLSALTERYTKATTSLTLHRMPPGVTRVAPLVEHWTRLRVLNLHGCHDAVDGLAPAFRALTSLTHLSVRDIPSVTDVQLEHIPVSVQHLTLAWLPGLTGPGLHHLGHLTHLERLTIEQNDNLVPAALVLPPTLAPSLCHLSVIRQFGFTDLCLAALAPFSRLVSLSLYWVPIEGFGFAPLAIKPLVALGGLSLHRCWQLQDRGLYDATRAFPNITTLHLRGVSCLSRLGSAYISRWQRLVRLAMYCGNTGTPLFNFLATLSLQDLTLLGLSFFDGGSLAYIVKTQAHSLRTMRWTGKTILRAHDLPLLERMGRLERFSWRHMPAGVDFEYVPGGGIVFSSLGVGKKEDFLYSEEEEEDDDEGEEGEEGEEDE